MLFLDSNVRQYKELLFHLYFVGKTTKTFMVEHLTTVSTTFSCTTAEYFYIVCFPYVGSFNLFLLKSSMFQ